MRVLVFGDSITQGFWDADGGWFSGIRTYFDQQMIDGSNDDPPTMFNLGVSGDSSKDLLARFQNEIVARASEPLAIVISIGVNDSRTKSGTPYSSTDEYAANLTSLLKVARQYTNNIMFIGLTPCVEARSNPVPWGNTGYTNERIKSFDATLQTFCDQHQVNFVDIYTPFTEALSQKELLPDGLHPNHDGHQLIAKFVLPSLLTLLALPTEKLSATTPKC